MSTIISGHRHSVRQSVLVCNPNPGLDLDLGPGPGLGLIPGPARLANRGLRRVRRLRSRDPGRGPTTRTGRHTRGRDRGPSRGITEEDRGVFRSWYICFIVYGNLYIKLCHNF